MYYERKEGREVQRCDKPHSLTALMLPINHANEPHHSLVDESPTLELYYAESVCRVGPGVLDHAPFILLGVNLH